MKLVQHVVKEVHLMSIIVMLALKLQMVHLFFTSCSTILEIVMMIVICLTVFIWLYAV